MPANVRHDEPPSMPTRGSGVGDWSEHDYNAEVRRLVAEFDAGLAELVARFRVEEAAAIAAAVDPA